MTNETENSHKVKCYENRGTYLSLGLVFLALVGIGVSSFVGFQTFLDSSRWIVHFNQVQQAPLRVIDSIEDMQKAQERYVMTGSQNRLKIYETLGALAKKHLGEFHNLTTDKFDQQIGAAKLEPPIQDYIATMDKTVSDFQKEGRQKALQEIRLQGQQRRMEHILEVEDQLGDNIMIGRGKRDEQKLGDAALSLGFCFSSALLLSLAAIFFIFRDLRTRRSAEKELVSREEAFRQSISSIKDYAIVALDKTGVIQSWNEGAEKIKGYSPSEIIGRNFSILYTAEDVREGRPEALLEKTARQGCVEEESWRVRKDGSLFLANVALTALKDKKGSSQGYIEVTRDVTQIKNEQKNLLRRSEKQLEALMENANDAIFTLKIDGEILSTNLQGEKLLKISRKAMIGRKYMEFNAPSDREHAKSYLEKINRAEKPAPEEFQLIQSDGKTCYVEFSVILMELEKEMVYLAIGRDVTERKLAQERLRKSEERLRESQKLEAIGQLSAGIAHDFNNILNVVSGNSELILSEIDEKDPNRAEVLEIQKAVLRGAQLTQQLLTFGRRDVSQPVILSLNTVLTDTVKMLTRMIGEDMDLMVKTDKNLKSIQADTIHVQQILMNLLSNARDAMPQGGKILIETRNMVLEDELQKGKEIIPCGSYVLLSVSDTGVGMDEETQKRIFEPFFTTKETGKGTGLGLATVYGIVKKSGGYLWVYSEKGEGTSFNVLLPAVDAAETSLVKSEAAAPAGGFETVLLVEDEAALRAIMARTLEKKGYVVIQAKDGEDGLDKAGQNLQKIDVVVTDTVMPKMSGKALADKIHELRPELKVIFTSGYPRQILSNQGMVDSDIHLIHKPFANDVLLTKVREVLDSRLN
jgi:PAS domain S-box-containing protein